MLGRSGSCVSFPDRYVPPFLEWTLTTSPLLPSTVLQLAGAGWVQRRKPVQSCVVPVVTHPGNRSQGLRGERLFNIIPCLGQGWLAARLQNRFTSPQWTEWFRL